MIAAMTAPFTDLIGHFAWPWWLLALPLPWLARALLPPLRGGSAARIAPEKKKKDRIKPRVENLGGRPLGGNRQIQ